MKKFNLLLLTVLIVVVLFEVVEQEHSSPQEIDFSLSWQQQALGCQSTFIPDNADNAWFIEQLQFFLSDFKVADQDGQWQKVALMETAYQTDNVVLLGENCRHSNNTQSSGSNWQVLFADNIDFSKVTKLAFTLGVPFADNHLNPLTQVSPLNIPSMFWVWQTGHKFMRLELASSDDKWLFHLGSTGCKSASVMRAPNEECRYPNKFEFQFAIDTKTLVENSLPIKLQLAKLLNQLDINAKNSCQSEATFLSCQQLFSNLRVEKNTPENSVFQVLSMDKD